MSQAVMEAAVDTRDAIRSIVESRRSVRQFKDEPVPDAEIREILRLTGLGPSMSNIQPSRWAVVRTPAMRDALSQAMTGNNVRNVAGAPVTLVLYSDAPEMLAALEEVMHPGLGAEEIKKSAAGLRQSLGSMPAEQLAEWTRAQTYISLGQLVIVARGMGYDTVTMGGFREDAVKDVLSLPETARVTNVIALGKRLQDGFTHHRHDVDRVSSWY